MWDAVTSCLTPTVALFCILNLTIVTVFITSALKKHQDKLLPQLVRVPYLLERVKSFNLSIYGSEHRDRIYSAADHQTQTTDPPQEPAHQHKSEFVVHRDRIYSAADHQIQTTDPPQEPADQHKSEFVEDSHVTVTRSRSDACVQAPTNHTTEPPQEPAHQEKSECVEESHVTVSRSRSDTRVQAPTKRVLKKSASVKAYVVEPEEDVDRRRPATVKEATSSNSADDEAVDSKADDFINRFRQQLKLQRSDSIVRFNEMLNRGVRN